MSIDYNEVKTGELLKWEKPGTVVEGVLFNYESKPDTGKGPGHLYEIKTSNGIVPFFAPTLLHKKLKNLPKGEIVKIQYEKEDKTKTTGNTLKIFNVSHATATESNLKALGLDAFQTIEDSDIDAAFEGGSDKEE